MIEVHYFKTILAGSALIALCGCHGSPIPGLTSSQIKSISISKGERTRFIAAQSEIDFIVSNIAQLQTNSDIKVHPEFNLTFFLVQGEPVRLRLGRDCIGPDVPASQYAKRWYFSDSKLYEFISSKFESSQP